jgi:amino acid permease
MESWIIMLVIVAAVLTILREKVAWRVWNIIGVLCVVYVLFLATPTILMLAGAIDEDSNSGIIRYAYDAWYVFPHVVGGVIGSIVALWMANYTRKMDNKVK